MRRRKAVKGSPVKKRSGKRPYVSQTSPDDDDDEQREDGDGARDTPKKPTVEEDWIPPNYNLFTDRSEKSRRREVPSDKKHSPDLSPGSSDSSDEVYCPDFVLRTGADDVLTDSEPSADTRIEDWSPSSFISITETSYGVLVEPVTINGSSEFSRTNLCNDDSPRSHVTIPHFAKRSDSNSKPVPACHDTDSDNNNKNSKPDFEKYSTKTASFCTSSRQLIEDGDDCLSFASNLSSFAPPLDSLVIESSTELRICKLEGAVVCYRRALSCSAEEEEEALASRGVAAACFKLAGLCSKNEADSKVLLGHYKESLKHFGLAYLQRFCMGLQWGHELVDSMEKCLEEFKDWTEGLHMAERKRCWSEVLSNVPGCRLKASGSLQYSTMLFDDGLALMRSGNHEECLRYLEECKIVIQEMEGHREGDPEIEKEIRVLAQGVESHSCLAEARIKRDRGDALLVAKETEHEGRGLLSKELVSDVIELYKDAAQLCADNDVQEEAIACSRLGRLYTKIGMLAQGFRHCRRVLELSDGMQPEMCLGKDWLVESRKIVEDFQRRLNTDEQETKNKGEALDNMEADVVRLKELDKSKTSDSEFVGNLYGLWPPEHLGAGNDFSQARPTGGVSQRKLLVRAISHYHPDKIDRGKNWYYFAAEITKILTRRYAALKKSL